MLHWIVGQVVLGLKAVILAGLSLVTADRFPLELARVGTVEIERTDCPAAFAFAFTGCGSEMKSVTTCRAREVVVVRCSPDEVARAVAKARGAVAVAIPPI